MCFLDPEKEKEKRSHVLFRLRFQLPAGSSRRFNLRRFEDAATVGNLSKDDDDDDDGDDGDGGGGGGGGGGSEDVLKKK